MSSISIQQNDDEHEKIVHHKNCKYYSNGSQQYLSSHLEWAEVSCTRWLHLLCWLWIKPIISLGYRKRLTENDLDGLPHTDKSSIIFKRLQSYDWTTKSIWSIIIQEFGKECAFAGALHIPFLITRMIQPLLIRQTILSTLNYQHSLNNTYVYAILLFLSAIINALFFRQADFYSIRVCVGIRSAFMTMI